MSRLKLNGIAANLDQPKAFDRVRVLLEFLDSLPS